MHPDQRIPRARRPRPAGRPPRTPDRGGPGERREQRSSCAAAATRAPASRSAASARSCGAATAGATGTAPGTTRSSSRRAPTAPAARPLRHGGFATQTDAAGRAGPGQGTAGHRRRPATCRRPSGSPTPSPPPCASTRTLPDPGRVRKQVGAGDDPAVRPPTVGEWLEEWLTAKKKLRPGTVRSYSGHISLYLKPHLGHIPHRPAPGHRRRLRSSTTSRNSTTPSPRPAPPAARQPAPPSRDAGGSARPPASGSAPPSARRSAPT